MSEHEKLREAVKRWHANRDSEKQGCHHILDEPWVIETIVRAAESTLPKTKMVEVWRVEWAFKTRAGWCPQCSEDATKAEAEIFAEMCRGHGHSCIRVTGPHQQEVPDAG